MGIGSMRDRLYPLHRGGGGGGGAASPRPAGMPSLVTPVIPGATGIFEDFLAPNWGMASYGVGTTASTGWPITHAAKWGSPGWVVFNAANPGTVSVSAFDLDAVYTSPLIGMVNIQSGSSANDETHLYSVQDRINLIGAPTTAMIRFKLAGTAANAIRGVGWTGSNTQDWISDPNWALAESGGIVLTRHAAIYDTDPAGDLMWRVYSANAGGIVAKGLALANASVSATTWYKFEMAYNGTDTLRLYLNGTLIGTVPVAPGVYDVMAPAAGAATTAGAARGIYVDCAYAEYAMPVR